MPCRIRSSSEPALVGEDGPIGAFALIAVQSTRCKSNFERLRHQHRELMLDIRTNHHLRWRRMTRELRAGIAGAGFIGAVHARSVRLAGARIEAVAASSLESAQNAADAFGAKRALSSGEELVNDPDIDVVHICTPNHLHLPLAEAALAAGKHVVCEKPLALDAAGALRLVDAAAASGLQAAVPFVYRYYPTVREARERVRSDATGDLRLLHGAYLQDWLLRRDDDNWRVDEELGGRSRAFADIGSHWCDLAQFISGHRIARISARLMTAIPERLSADGRRAFAGADGEGKAREVSTEDA